MTTWQKLQLWYRAHWGWWGHRHRDTDHQIRFNPRCGLCSFHSRGFWIFETIHVDDLYPDFRAYLDGLNVPYQFIIYDNDEARLVFTKKSDAEIVREAIKVSSKTYTVNDPDVIEYVEENLPHMLNHVLMESVKYTRYRFFKFFRKQDLIMLKLTFGHWHEDSKKS